ncbi:MAG: glycosyltransferase family 2 protein [Roseibium album]|uniref:glycosyltransferase family 2 protein n=1 Tax=Roseibium album TaxID=311410 RepID=UPI002A637E83|nr:glycosyltransferase family 2 protein [Paracoccaceae bacterium]
MSSPDLSIVIVNWNTKALLNDCLTSCSKSPNADNEEIIVVDNASDDGSVEMVKADFPNVVLIENQTNRGFAAANNQGFEVAQGRHILLLNSDTVVHGDVLAQTVRYMDEFPDIGVLGCRVLNPDGTTQPNTSRFPSLLNLIILSSGLWKIKSIPFFDRYRMQNWDRKDARDVEIVAGCYMTVRKEAMDVVGPLDEDFYFFGEETDWCVRFKRAGWRVHCAPVGEITHLGGGSAKKLNHKRDVMLTDATIRLHRKYYGNFSAFLAWAILMLFNTSRFLFWKLASFFSKSERVIDRKNHFLKVTCATPSLLGSRTK